MKNKKNTDFIPKFFSLFKGGYTKQLLLGDLWAGIIVGIVALPLSIAFAIASGVKPEQGLYTAIVAGFIISLLSGSRVQIGGPTGAFIVIIFTVVQKFGYDGLALATMMAGVLLLIMGFARLGDVIKFIPYPVTIGFTSGIALIIFTTQIPDFLGLTLSSHSQFFAEKWLIYFLNLSTTNYYSLIISSLTVITIFYFPKLTRKIPGSIVAIIATTLLVHFNNWPVDTIASRFGTVSNTFPVFHFPVITFDALIKLSSSALAIALLAGIESLLSAVVADGMTGFRHRSNMELVAQGIANIVSPLFSGIPATGAIARTATNIKNGGRTPISGIVHAITILIIFLFCGKLAAFIPMACLSGILIVVAYHMSEMKSFAKILQSPRSDMAVLLVTFSLTVLVDLTVAIEVGIVLAAILFMKRMIDTTNVNLLTDDIEEEHAKAFPDGKIPDGIEIYEINGPFFFGAAEKFKDTMHEIEKPPLILILKMQNVPIIDATGLKALEDVIIKTKKDKTTLIVCGARGYVFKNLKEADLVEKIGKENFALDIPQALMRSKEILKHKTNAT